MVIREIFICIHLEPASRQKPAFKVKTRHDQTGLSLWQWALRYSHTSVRSFLWASVLEGCTVLVSKHWSLQLFEWQDLGFPFHLWLNQAYPSLLCALIPEAAWTVTTSQNRTWPEAHFFAQKTLGLLPDSLALFLPGKGISHCKNKQCSSFSSWVSLY